MAKTVSKYLYAPTPITNLKKFKDGGDAQCHRCGFYYPRDSEKMHKFGNNRYICYKCIDPEDY